MIQFSPKNIGRNVSDIQKVKFHKIVQEITA